MKIKRKAEMNLPQLIEWGFENTEVTKGRVFSIDDENARFAPYVSFLADGMGVRVPCTITHEDTFTVEVEEYVTEGTELDNLYKMDSYKGALKSAQSTIAQDLEISVLEPISYYILNDDLTMTLIWRDGKLVE